jgi:pimeloyl-ACP methyl ester carboxylesterase
VVESSRSGLYGSSGDMSHKIAPGNGGSAPPSQWVDIDGSVHYVDYGGPDDGPRLVLVHGLGGSLVSWAAVAPALAQVGRVIALDLAGFGRSPGSPRRVTLPANQVLLHRFLLQVAGTPAIVIGHSMGGTIAAMLSAQHPDTTAGLIFIDPAVPWQVDNQTIPRLTGLVSGMAASAPGQAGRQGRLMLEQALQRARTGCERAFRNSPQAIERSLAAIQIRLDDGQMNSDMLAASRSLTLVVSRRREFASMLSQIKVPVLMLHGERDKFVPISAARATARANPAWRFEVASGVGHVPPLEAPQWTIDRITAWLGAEGAGAFRLARTASRLPGTGEYPEVRERE